MRRIAGIVAALLLLTPLALPAQGTRGDLPETPAGIRATQLLEALEGSPADRRALLEDAFTSEYRASTPAKDWMSELDRLAADLDGAERTGVRMAGPTEITVAFRTEDGGRLRLSIRVSEDEPHRIRGVQVEAGEGPGASLDIRSWEHLDAMLRKQEASGRFAGVILAARNDELAFHRAYGQARRDPARPVRRDTRFNIGSLVKPFTGAVILRLAQEGRLHLNDTVGRYVEGLRPEVAGHVTIMHLLRHRSGLGDYLRHPEFREQPDRFRSVDALVSLVREQPLDFEPGAERRYSNSGFVLLGAVIEAVTGRSYGQVLEEWIFRPAGMEHTSLGREAAEGAAAVPYRRAEDGGLEPVGHLHASRGSPAGGGYSTAGDLHAFARAVLSDRLLEPQWTNLLLAGYDRTVAREEGRVGVGWGGGAPGVNATLEIDPDGTVVAAVANRDPPAATRVGVSVMRWLRRKR